MVKELSVEGEFGVGFVENLRGEGEEESVGDFREGEMANFWAKNQPHTHIYTHHQLHLHPLCF